MRVAQRLYEGGYITYMRTDSTTLSETALTAARAQARELYGDDYVPEAPRQYASKVKNAQEAHEAIRPAGATPSVRRARSPASSAGRRVPRLYELVWQRTLASQMADATGQSVTVRLGATTTNGDDAEFAASGKVITFPGFLGRLRQEARRGLALRGRRGAGGKNDGDDARVPRPRRVRPLVRSPDRTEGAPHDSRRRDPPRRRSCQNALEERKYRPALHVRRDRPGPIVAVQCTRIDRSGGAHPHRLSRSAVIGACMEKHFDWLIDYDFTADMAAPRPHRRRRA